MFRWVRKLYADVAGFGAARSACWRKARADHLAKYPCCAACGARDGVDVHHLKPVWLYPSLQCDPENLLTLCGHPRNCHWSVGHGFDWKSYRPDAAALAATMLQFPVIRPNTD